MTATATPTSTSAATRKQPANNNNTLAGKAFTVKRLLAVSVHYENNQYNCLYITPR